MESIDKIYDLLNEIKVTPQNEKIIVEIRNMLESKNYFDALAKMKVLKEIESTPIEEVVLAPSSDEEEGAKYPDELCDENLERIYIGLLLETPKLISKYYFLFDLCAFEDDNMLNIYKSILFNEGAQYSSEKAKDRFNFSKDTHEVYELKKQLLKEVLDNAYNIEEIYISLKKLFILRNAYIETPEKNIQDKIVEITKYELYNKMSPEEVILY